jgi:hypothetical protein
MQRMDLDEAFKAEEGIGNLLTGCLSLTPVPYLAYAYTTDQLL